MTTILTFSVLLLGVVAWNTSWRSVPQPWPLAPTWPRVELTPAHAETFSDDLVALIDALETDMQHAQGQHAQTILTWWQAEQTDAASSRVAASLTTLLDHGAIELDHLYRLLTVAHAIQQLKDHGTISVQSRVEHGHVVVLIHNMASNQNTCIPMSP